MYNVTESTYVSAHRTENDDLGYDGNYYGITHNISTGDGQGIEMGVYLHDKTQRSVFTGAHTDHGQNVLGSIKYTF